MTKLAGASTIKPRQGHFTRSSKARGASCLSTSKEVLDEEQLPALFAGGDSFDHQEPTAVGIFCSMNVATD